MNGVLKRLLVTLALFMCALNLEPAHGANQPGAVVQLQNVAQLAGSNYFNTPQVQLSGYYNPSDGGEGTLVLKTCTPDAISCFADNAGNTYYRTNLSGDMRQGGVTSGSGYDISTHPTNATDATPIITAAYTALSAIGLHRVDTKQVSVILRTVLNIPANGELTCSIETGGPFSSGNYTNRPGTIVTSHLAYIHANSNSTSVHHCMGLPEWYVNPSVVSAFGGYSFNLPPTVEADMEAYRGNMVRAADTWLFSDNARAAKFSHIWVYGFDNPVHFDKPNEVDMSFCWLDGDISLYSTSGGSSTSVQTCRSEPYLRRQVDIGWVGPGNVPNQEDFSIRTITAGASNTWGTHECRLTIQANGSDSPPYPVTDIQQSDNDSYGQPVTFGLFITNLDDAGSAGGPGAVSCLGTGPWPTHNLSYNSGTQTLTLDLLNSQYGHGADAIVLTGTWEGGENTSGCLCATIRVASGDMNSLYVGETVTGTGIGAGTTIKYVPRSAQGPDPWSVYLGEIIVQFTAGNAPVRQSGVTTLTVDSGAYSPGGTDCGAQSDNGYGCVYLNAAVTAIAGSSAAGLDIAAMPLNRGKPTSASWFWHDTVGLRFINVQNFDHAINFANFASNACTLIGDGGDDNGEIDWTGVLGFYIAGKTNHCNIYGGSLGKSGTPIVIDTWDNSDFDSHTATLSGSLGTGGAGTTITTGGGFNTFSKDAWGFFGLHICQNLSGTNCTAGGDPANGSEVISCVYVSDTVCTVVGRGLYGTTPKSFTNGAHLFAYTTGFGSNIVQFFGTGENNTEQDLNSFQLSHGGFGLFGDIERGNNRSGYISHNVYLAKFTANIMTGLFLVYEDATALAGTSGCINTFAQVQSWECYSASPIGGLISSNTILDGTAHSWKCDATSGNVTITAQLGATYPNWDNTVTKVDFSSNLCIITGNASDTIGGSASVPLGVGNQSIHFKNDNGTANWVIQ